MITLIKIGFDYYAVKEAAAAAKVITALAGAITLRQDYKSSGKHCYYPDEHQNEISMFMVREDQVLRSKPAAELPARKQLSAPSAPSC